MKINVYYMLGDQHCCDKIKTNLPGTSGLSEHIEAAYAALGIEVACIHLVHEIESTLG